MVDAICTGKTVVIPADGARDEESSGMETARRTAVALLYIV
jgi:hypothetical protein